MRNTTISFFFIMSMLTMTSMAQQDHGHFHGTAVTEEEAKILAKNIVVSLAESNKIDKSWNAIEVAAIAQKTFDGHLEWVVTFQNDLVEDVDKRTFYVFLTLGGKQTGVNYTGK